MVTHSAIYSGVVHHSRRIPVLHEFKYSLFLMYVDLDELPELFRGNWLWSARRPNIAWFRRGDHLGSSTQSLADSVRELVEQRLGFRPEGPIRLLTHFRYFGFQMNPVSFFYCFDRQGIGIEAIVAEVNNTPWNEQHCYVLDLRGCPPIGLMTADERKAFHVSPFLGMDYHYRFSLSHPRERLSIRIELETDSGTPFDAAVSMNRLPLSSWNLNRMLLLFPAMTLQIFAKIYWQAFRLWWKRVPLFKHPGQVLHVDSTVT